MHVKTMKIDLPPPPKSSRVLIYNIKKLSAG